MKRVYIDMDNVLVDFQSGLDQDFLATGTVKSFEVKDPTGKVVCEYDDGFWD